MAVQSKLCCGFAKGTKMKSKTIKGQYDFFLRIKLKKKKKMALTNSEDLL